MTDRESIRDLAPTAYETFTDGLRRTNDRYVIVSKPILAPGLYNAEVFQVKPSEIPRDQRPRPPEVINALGCSPVSVFPGVPHREREKRDLGGIVPALLGDVFNPRVDRRQVTLPDVIHPPVVAGYRGRKWYTLGINSPNTNGGV